MTNPKIKELKYRLSRKEADIKLLNEKITKVVKELQNIEDQTKVYDRKLDKENGEAERLRNFLNYLLNHS